MKFSKKVLRLIKACNSGTILDEDCEGMIEDLFTLTIDSCDKRIINKISQWHNKTKVSHDVTVMDLADGIKNIIKDKIRGSK